MYCLDLHPTEIFPKITQDVAGIWVDNAEIDERAARQSLAEQPDEARRKSGWQGLYFGGVAFKYQRHIDEVEAAAAIAARMIDVITTSGPVTGQQPDVAKIRATKNGAGNCPIAIASGITLENVADYLVVRQNQIVTMVGAVGIDFSTS